MEQGNRTAVISGATGGLGSHVAETLAQKGYNLGLVDRHSDSLTALTNSLAQPESCVLAREVNLLDPIETEAAAEAIAAKFGKIDVLLHLVGGWVGGKTLFEASAEDLEFMLNQHVWTSFNVIRAFVPHLVKNMWGRVIMITSPQAARPGSKSGPYATGKAGQEALMMTLAQELKGSGVTANMIQVKTIDLKREKISAPTAENASWSTPEEIIASILYLLSPEAGTVNGAKIPLHQ